jgi:hypothetical protein
MLLQVVELYVMNLALLMTMAREAWVLLVAMAWARKHHMAMETEVDQGAVGAVADRATSGWSLPRGSA